MNGSLAVARAFGDKMLKKPNGSGSGSGGGNKYEPTTAVTVAPEITHYCPYNNDNFIIMATDGLWDVFSSQSAVDWVTSRASGVGLLGSSGVL